MHPRSDLLAKVGVQVKVNLTKRNGHYFTGKFWAFDGHLNVVLSSAEEVREFRVKEVSSAEVAVGEEPEEVVSWSSRTEKREVGLIVLRGSWVESIEELEVPRQRRDREDSNDRREGGDSRDRGRQDSSSAPRPRRRESGTTGGSSRDRDESPLPMGPPSKGRGGDCKQQ